MAISTFITAAFAGCAVASAIPPRIGIPAIAASNFSVEQVRNEHFGGRNGPLALAKVYAKYGAPLPADLKDAVDRIRASLGTGAKRRSTGSATNTPTEYDSEYLTPVSIGTPAQQLNLDFDTGSSDLWVFSSETPSSDINGQSIYTPADSSTSKKLSGQTWSISYGDGSSSSGDVYDDKVTVGGLTVSKQAVEVASTVSSEFTSDTDSDGLLGLAFSSINTVTPTAQKTFFDNAKSSLDSPVFTADLKAGEPGKYNFGYIDDSAYTGDLTYTDVDSSQGFWGFTSPAYAIGSAAKTSTSISGIADTGTTLLLLPNTVVKAYYKKITGAKYDSSQGGYVFPCTRSPPSFTYYIEDSSITIPGSYFNYAPVDSTGSSCYGGLQSSDDVGISIYGDVALKAAFVVFDGDSSPRLGFAAKDL